MDQNINVSSSPHLRSKHDTPYIMRMVLLALLIPAVFGVINFGFKALLILLVSMASCIIFESICNKLMGRKNSIHDGSALVTGLLLGMNLPVSAPIWLPIVGSAFAIVIVKMIFGGLGQNIVNPALAARCFLLISFAGAMCNFTSDASFFPVVDAMSSATPLALLKAGESVNLLQLFIGFTTGTIGETSTLAILIGGIFLSVKKIIDIRIPVSYLLTFSLFVFFLSPNSFDIHYLLCQLCAGGLMLGAWFMATDYVTSPITPNGRILFGIILGILTGLFRCLGNGVEGVSYAILFANLLVPLIEKLTMRKAFGRGKNHA